jgi:hypothetical protein
MAALAFAIASYASSANNDLSPLARFQISGDATAPLFPGGPASPVDLSFTNPNTFPIAVSGVAVKVDGTSSAACDASNFSVGSQLPSSLSLPPSATRSLSQLGIPNSDWPRVAMVDSSASQDACKNASVQLAYSGEATANEPADTPVGSASGPVYVNGHLFKNGGIAYGSTVLIKSGGRLELSTPAGTITVYAPKGKSIRFTVQRVSVKLPYPLKGGAASASAKPKSQVYIELELTGGGLSRCPAKTAPTTARSKTSSPERSLWAKGKGRLRVRGRFGVTTGRNAWWLTQDSCSGTRVRVKKGTVRMDDVTKPSPVFVKAGHSYLAHSRVKVGLKRKSG